MDNTTVTPCVCTGATPIATPTQNADVQQTLNATTQAMNNAMNKLENEEKVSKAQGLLNQFTEFINSDKFVDECKRRGKETGIPPKKIAESFFGKVLGTIGDIFGIVVGTVENFCHTLVNLVGTVANGIVNVICNIARGLGSIVTFNKTAVNA